MSSDAVNSIQMGAGKTDGYYFPAVAPLRAWKALVASQCHVAYSARAVSRGAVIHRRAGSGVLHGASRFWGADTDKKDCPARTALEFVTSFVECSGTSIDAESPIVFEYELAGPQRPLSEQSLDCDVDSTTPSFPIWWTPRGEDWTDQRLLKLEIALLEAARLVDGAVRYLDVLENADFSFRQVYWSSFPSLEMNLETYFGLYDDERFMEVREVLHEIVLAIAAEGGYSTLPILAGVSDELEAAAPGLFCDTFDAWSYHGEIGVCLDTLDAASSSSIASLLIHEIAHRVGRGHASAPYCESVNSECRSEADCRLLAQNEPWKTVLNADSFRFFVSRFGGGGCIPYSAWAYSEGVLNGTTQFRTRWLCSYADPFDSSSPWSCQPKVTCYGPDTGYDGSATFSLCRL